MLFADKEPGAEIYGAACDRNQASIVFDVAAEMVRLNPKLGRRCKILDSTKRIIHNNRSFYRVLSSEVPAKHGLNVHGVIFDELHAQPNRQLWDVLTLGSGAARTQHVIFAITTAGYDRNSICYEQHDYARKVRDGIIEDPTFLPVIYSADKKADWTDEKVWKKCNPSWGITFDADEFRQECKLAQELPALENTFRRLRLNQWVKQEVRFIPMDNWMHGCGGTFDPEMLKGKICYAGLDLASTTDIAAFVMLFELDGLIYALCRFWVPEENIALRSKRDKVDYDLWARQGYIISTPGNAIDYDYIEEEIIRLGKGFRIEEIAFDPHGATQITQHLADAGFTVIDFDQRMNSMSPPSKEFLRIILRGQFRHGDNPVLTWMADNVTARMDSNEQIKPDKKKSTEKIDGIVAAIMALDRLNRKGGAGISY